MTTQNSARKAQAIRKLRRDILSSKVLATLDKKEGKTTSNEIMILSRLNLPTLAVTPDRKVTYAKTAEVSDQSLKR